MEDEEIKKILEAYWIKINPKHQVTQSQIMSARFILEYTNKKWKN